MNKQIEEMAREVCGNYHKGDCVGGECVCDYQCASAVFANRLYNASYRKASDGEWGFDGMDWTCSECGEYALLDKYNQAVRSDFCPHCGAKMKYESEGADDEN